VERFAEFFANSDRNKKIWNSHYTGILLWLGFFALWIHWHPYSHLTTPGKAIGVIAIVAGIMSVRDMEALAKATWVLLLIVFLFIEFRAIDKDHYANEEAQKIFFDEQRRGFEKVTGQAGKNFRDTAGGLTAAIAGIKSTLETANKTLIQTQPRAYFGPVAF
jgi:hypothetical protein